VLHLKVDELIRISESARNKLLDLKDLTEAELSYDPTSADSISPREITSVT
jgi:low affinity Fe/Cu permease